MTRRAALPALFLAGLASLAVATPRYTVTDLGTLGGNETYARDINNKGVVVGDADNIPFAYYNGTLHSLGGSGIACAINSQGTIVGYSYSAMTAFVYSNGVRRNLSVSTDALPSANRLSITDINDRGQITGILYFYSADFDDITRSIGFLSDHGKQTNFPSRINPEFSMTSAFGVSSKGEVIVNDSGHPFIFQSGHPIKKIPGAINATVITGAGRVFGLDRSAHRSYSFLDGKVSRMPINIVDANSRGTLVGVSNHGVSNILKSDRLIPIKQTLPANAPQMSVTGINDSGVIIANAWIGGDQYRAFLLTPVSTVTIAGPKSVVISGDTVLVRGKATGKVIKVRYQVGKSAYRTASGKKHWKFHARLAPGKNVISVYARTAKGDSLTEQKTLFLEP